MHDKLIYKEDRVFSYNSDGQKHGYWEVWQHNKKLWYITNYVNGERFGYYHFNWNGREDREYYAR
jgi:hypothetical protein